MFGRKKRPKLHLEFVEKFCSDPTHYKNILDYGAHPRRLYAVCFAHEKPQAILLDWKDTYARTMNRIIASFPAVFGVIVASLTILYIILNFIP